MPRAKVPMRTTMKNRYPTQGTVWQFCDGETVVSVIIFSGIKVNTMAEVGISENPLSLPHHFTEIAYNINRYQTPWGA
jgi:hypothetical protein